MYYWLKYSGLRLLLSPPNGNLSANVIPFLFGFILCALYVTTLHGKIEGVFINSYPFLTPDSYDYLFEGIALEQFLKGESLDAWPVLRNPGYVVVAFIDAMAGLNGSGLIVAQGLAICALLMSISWFGARKNFPPLVTILCVFAVAFMPLGYLYLYILSDTLCMAIMMLSLMTMIIYIQEGGRSKLLTAFIFALLAGLVQTYGMIPFLMLAGLKFLDQYFYRNKIDYRLLLTMLLLFVSWLAIQTLWASIIPHDGRPKTFSLLRLNFDMASFYANVWVFSLLPLLPFLLYGIKSTKYNGKYLQVLWIKLSLIVASFMLITFFYQWSESRFTAFYIPIFVVALMSLAADLIKQGRPAKLVYCLLSLSGLLYGLIGITLAPPNYWQPELKTISYAPEQSWLRKAFDDTKYDRYLLKSTCGSMEKICSGAFVPWQDPYVSSMLSNYKARVTIGQPAYLALTESAEGLTLSKQISSDKVWMIPLGSISDDLSRIRQLGVIVGTYARRNENHIVVEIRDGSDNVLSTVVVQASRMVDNAASILWMGSLSLLDDGDLYLVISSSDASAENTEVFYQQPNSKHLDSYFECDLVNEKVVVSDCINNGVKINGSLLISIAGDEIIE